MSCSKEYLFCHLKFSEVLYLQWIRNLLSPKESTSKNAYFWAVTRFRSIGKRNLLKWSFSKLLIHLELFTSFSFLTCHLSISSDRIDWSDNQRQKEIRVLVNASPSPGLLTHVYFAREKDFDLVSSTHSYNKNSLSIFLSYTPNIYIFIFIHLFV